MCIFLKNRIIMLFIPLLMLSACGASLFASGVSRENPTSVQVRQVNLLPGNHYPPFSPRSVTNQQKVEALYNRVLALPHLDMNAGPRSCPVDTGLEYKLDFFQGQVLQEEATYAPGGCSSLTIGKDDVRIPDKAFAQALAQTLGISLKELLPIPLFSCTPKSPCPSPTP